MELCEKRKMKHLPFYCYTIKHHDMLYLVVFSGCKSYDIS